MFHLTLQQLQVVDALSNGATLTDAAAQAGIHRNTIANWRSSDDFRAALASAHHDRAVLYRDRAVDLADLAFEALRTVLTDPKSSPSIRLRAAIFIIDKASTPPKFEKEKPATMADMFAAMAETDCMHLSEEQPPEPASDAQECTTASNDARPNPVFYMHNSAQPPETYPTAVPSPKPAAMTFAPVAAARNTNTAVWRPNPLQQPPDRPLRGADPRSATPGLIPALVSHRLSCSRECGDGPRL